MVPEFAHRPVMLAEVLEALRPGPGGIYADGTVGGGGHSEAILAASAPDGWLYGCDRDDVAMEAARLRLRRFEGRFEIRRGRFDELADWVPPGSCNGIVLDLGVSSPQLDQAERGFSFQQEGPLDMRMDRRQRLTAADLVNEADTGELAKIFWEYGEEREARRFARSIVEARLTSRFETTRQLAEHIERLVPRKGLRVHPATRVFQALRIAVNDELKLVENGLDAVWTLLAPGGRLAVITFHSLEDRIVKLFGRRLARDYEFDGNVDVPELRRPVAPKLKLITRKAIQPSEAEISENPRARSAQLRVMERI